MKKFSMILSVLFTLAVFSTPAFAALKNWKVFVDGSAKEITVAQLKQKMNAKKKFVLIDVREANEFDAGHIKGAINVPRGYLEFKMPRMYKAANTQIVVYCKSGARGMLATQALVKLGYKNAVNLQGAFLAWVKGGNEYYNYHGSSKIAKFGAKE